MAKKKVVHKAQKGYGDIAKLYGSTHKLAVSKAQSEAQGFNDAAQVQNEKEAAAAGAANARAAAAAKLANLKAMIDPNAYQKVRRDDGGFDFVDPNGEVVDVSTVADRTGENQAKLLYGSENPEDIAFMADFEAFSDYLLAKVTNDTTKIDEYKKLQPLLDNPQYDNPEAIKGAFRDYYAKYFGQKPKQGFNTQDIAQGALEAATDQPLTPSPNRGGFRFPTISAEANPFGVESLTNLGSQTTTPQTPTPTPLPAQDTGVLDDIQRGASNAVKKVPFIYSGLSDYLRRFYRRP